MNTYICKCGRRVQKSGKADNTGYRIENYRPGSECYGCPYAMPWGKDKWDEATKHFMKDVKGYECRISPTLSYDSRFIGSTKDKCTCAVISLDFDFLEQISAWVKDTFPQGELTGGFSRDKIRPTDYSHNGRYCCTFVCAANKKGISAKAALLARFFNPDGNRKGMTPQQEMEKILADIKKAKEAAECLTAQNTDAAATAAESAAPNATAETPTTSESGADASALTPATSLQNCESAPVASAGGSSVSTAGAMQDKPLTFIREDKCPAFDYSGLTDQTVEDLHFAEDEYRHGKKLAEKGLVYMGNAIAAAHDALCDTVVAQCDNGRFAKKEDTFRTWCLHIGITKDSAYRLLQVSALIDGSSPRQRAILESLPPTLLYAVAKPSAPPELVEKAKNGEVATNKAYQELLAQVKAKDDAIAAEKARADNAEAHLEAAQADVAGLKEQNGQLKENLDAANAREEEAWSQREKAETRARNAENALKKQPITGVVDKDEVKRQADALAAKAAAQASKQVEDAQRRAREAEAKFEKLQQAADSFLSPEQACEQQAKLIADSLRSMYLSWFGSAIAVGGGGALSQMGTPLYAVCGEIMSSLEDDTSINPTAAGSVEDAEREALFE